jgi:hypothetical protein
MTLVGFIMAYPDAILVSEARSTVNLALSVFDNFGAKFTVARNAAKLCETFARRSTLFWNISSLGIRH